jgi:hypothetical protein
LCVVQHGGSVAPSYSSAVTHLVLWPLGWDRQHLAGGVLFGAAAATADQQQQEPSLLLPQVLLARGERGGVEGQYDQQHQQVGVPAEQLVQLLAAAATAATDTGITTAAAAAAAKRAGAGDTTAAAASRSVTPAAAAAAAAAGGSSSIADVAPPKSAGRSILRPSKGRFKIAAPTAPPPAPAAAAAPAALPAAAPAAAPEAAEPLLGPINPPSPAAIKLLRKMRRRLLAAQDYGGQNHMASGEQLESRTAGLFEGEGMQAALCVQVSVCGLV